MHRGVTEIGLLWHPGSALPGGPPMRQETSYWERPAVDEREQALVELIYEAAGAPKR